MGKLFLNNININININIINSLWDNIDEEYIIHQLNKINKNGDIVDINLFAKLIATYAENVSTDK